MNSDYNLYLYIDQAPLGVENVFHCMVLWIATKLDICLKNNLDNFYARRLIKYRA